MPRMSRRAAKALLTLVLLATAALGAMAGRVLTSVVPGVAAARATSVAFRSAGATGRFTVPAGVTGLQVTVVGGPGGAGGGGAAGGRGAVVVAGLPVTPGQTLLVDVGTAGRGADRAFAGGAGGSSSDVRSVTGGPQGTLSGRLVVAAGGGGGGGAGTAAVPDGGVGGAAGGPGAGAGADGGGGGGRAGAADEAGAGGATGGVAGVFSAGGAGAVARLGSGNGGGAGGGWFGGGGGGGGVRGAGGGGGGGGSSFVTPLASHASVGLDGSGVPSVTITTVPAGGAALSPVLHAALLAALAVVVAGGLALLSKNVGTLPL
jgi:hypothetical protein